MTVSTQNSKISYQANGSTTMWTFSFPGVAPSNILVFITASNGVVTQAPASAYTVTLNQPVDPNPTSIGGQVLYPVTGPPLATGNTITIVRELPEVQPTSIANQSVIYPPIIEQEFDYLTMICQQTSEMISRAVVVGIADTPMDPLPSLAFRINQPAVFDGHGNLTAGGIPGGGVLVSPAMIPVVGAPTLPAARTAMGVPGIDSPAFTGVPTAPTPVGPPHNNDTTIATTEFVQALASTLGVIFPSGTAMIFRQTTPPPGWTKDVAHNEHALRVVSGAVGQSGTLPFSTVFTNTATGGHAITLNEMAFHSHVVSDPTHSHGYSDPGHVHTETSVVTASTGAGAEPKGVDTSVDQSSGSISTQPGFIGISISAVGTGISLQAVGQNVPHTHPLDMRVLYADVIIATKD